MKLKIKDTKFFVSVLSTFSSKPTLTFSLKECLTVQSSDQIFLLEKNSYTLIHPGKEFTVPTLTLLKNISILSSYQITLICDDKLCLLADTKPFTIKLNVNLVKYEMFSFYYKEPEIKFLISNFSLLKDFSSETIYEIKNGKLHLKSVNDLQSDSIFINLMDDNSFNGRILVYENEFVCNNSWISNLKGVSSYISGVMFCVCEFVLTIQILFKKYEESYLEIQTYKKLEI